MKLFLMLLVSHIFSVSAVKAFTSMPQASVQSLKWSTIRGGQQQPIATSLQSSLTTAFVGLGESYGGCLESYPLRTKSITACLVFFLSDYLAQRVEDRKSLDARRLVTGALVGLLYFGPAAHYWYETIFKLLPGTSLLSTLQKAVLGQLLFGPAFTCIFFAVSMRHFSFMGWMSKIRQDLPVAWKAGLGFWPLVDLVSYALIAPAWIPLFVNVCSLVWTIYLSLIANRN